MPVRSIATWPSPVLKEKSEFVDNINESTVQLACDLIDTMNVSFGAGLASTQIGVLQSVVVIKTDYGGLSLKSDPVLKSAVVLVNPVVELIGDEKFSWEEACLSIPDYQGMVRRHHCIKLTYTNLLGEQKSFLLEGVPAGIVQHETDHLIGKLFVDRMSPANRRLILMRLRRKIQNEKKSRLKFLKSVATEEEQQHKPEHIIIGRPKRRKKLPKTFGKNKKKK
jgi:peptide deformylase